MGELMSSPEDILHDRLLRLEEGEPLEACLQGVPPEIKQALEIAYKLRHLEWSGQNIQAVAAQRSKLLSLATSNDTLLEKEIKMNNLSNPKKPVWQTRRLAFIL